jgi:hypothetical protein
LLYFKKNKFIYVFISLQYVVHVYQLINLSSNDFSMVVILYFMPILKMIYLKKRLLHHYMLALVHINQKDMNFLNYNSTLFLLMLILLMSLLDIDIFFIFNRSIDFDNVIEKYKNLFFSFFALIYKKFKYKFCLISD